MSVPLPAQFIAHTVSSSPVNSIIRPWRALSQRRLITTPHLLDTVWFRTSYEECSNAKHAECSDFRGVDIETAVGDVDQLLDNPSCYKFSAERNRIFDASPELVTGTSSDEAMGHASSARLGLPCTRPSFVMRSPVCVTRSAEMMCKTVYFTTSSG